MELVGVQRALPWVSALIPAVVGGLAVRFLTIGTPALPVRAAVAAVIALAGWTAYRILTVRLAVDDEGLHLRGVLVEAEIPWSAVMAVQVVPAARPLRALLWGVMQPHTLALRTATRTLYPLAAVGAADDDDLRAVTAAIKARIPLPVLPTQREPERAPAPRR